MLRCGGIISFSGSVWFFDSNSQSSFNGKRVIEAM